MKTDGPKLGVLTIGRKRPGFDQDWNQIMRRQCAEALGQIDVDAEILEPIVDEQTTRAAIARLQHCDALLILQPSLGNGQLAVCVTQGWPKAAILWATPERQDSGKASSCSLVAQHLWASIFRQAKYPFEFVYGHPNDDRVRRDLSNAISLCQGKAKLNRAKLGSIGGNAPGFLAMAPDTFDMKRLLGVQLAMLSLPQFMARARGLGEAEVKDDVERVRAMKLPMRDVTPADLPTQSRLYLAMRQLIEEEALDAMSVQDWPELPNEVGQWPYLAISRLADEGFPIAMEGDADSALLCLLARELNMGPGFITDWLEHDDETITFWHAGTIPSTMCPPAGSEGGPTLAKHFNIEKPLVLDGTLRADQPITVARLWRCDGAYHMTAFEGHTLPLRRKLTGNAGLARIEGGHVFSWFDTLCHAGFPHHPVVFYGHHRESLRRMARMLSVDWLDKR